MPSSWSVYVSRSTSSDNKKWIKTTEREHNIDSRIVALVRLLARKAAEQDYQALLDKHSPEKEAKDED